nr:unnamed protein product [Callosobruchus analis]
MEPPSRLEFSNSSGGWLDCSASGSPQPQVDWLGADGQPAGDVPGVRRVLRNGTLYLMPFAAHAYRQDVHSTIYRCMASNSVGRVLSRDVQVRAGKYWYLATNKWFSANSLKLNQNNTENVIQGVPERRSHRRTPSH